MKVTFIRTGTLGHINRKAEGAFTKEFSSIPSLVKFLVDANFRLLIKDADLTKEQRRILNIKFRRCRQEVLKRRKSIGE